MTGTNSVPAVNEMLYGRTRRPHTMTDDMIDKHSQRLTIRNNRALFHHFRTVMLSPRSQSGLEAKILASASASNIWHRPGLDLVV